MTPVDWDSPLWGVEGHNVHYGSYVSDQHDESEAAAERSQG